MSRRITGWAALAACGIMLAGGCATLSAPDMAEPDTLRAQGNEPGWRVDLGADRLALTADYGAVSLSLPRPDAAPAGDGWRFQGEADDRSVVLHVHPGLCRDSMTGMPYPFRAELQLDDRVLPGCAGEPASLLIGSDWQVVEIAGTTPVEDSEASIRFDEESRVTGQGSCNRYMGSYRLSGEGLGVSRLASTKMACAEELMDQEQRFLQLLGQTQRFDIDDDGALILHAEDGRTIRAVR